MTTLTRFEDWPSRLSRFIKQKQSTMYEWGKHDCCWMVVDWIYNCTGEMVAPFFKGKYKNHISAYRLLHNFAGGIEGTFEKIMGDYDQEEISKTHISRGDICIAKGKGVDKKEVISGGVCTGEMIIIPAVYKGIEVSPLVNVIRAWRV